MSLDADLASLLDTLIPPSEERGLPGAGALGLADRLPMGEIAGVVQPGLEALRARAGDAGFGALPLAERVALVEAVAAEQPAFVPAILFHLIRAYYAEPAVLEALGMPGRPPFPIGYEMAGDDLSALEGPLDAVRAREKLYRDA